MYTTRSTYMNIYMHMQENSSLETYTSRLHTEASGELEYSWSF